MIVKLKLFCKSHMCRTVWLGL